MTKFIFLILLSSLLVLFLASGVLFRDSTPPDEKITNQIVEATAKELKKRYNLNLIGVGGSNSAGDNKVQVLMLSFAIYRPLSIDEARKILLDSVKLLEKNVNDNKDVQPYLKDIPFSEKNIELTIFIYSQDRRSLYHPDTSVITNLKGNIRFLTKDPDTNAGPYKSEIEESYQEAMEKAGMSPSP